MIITLIAGVMTSCKQINPVISTAHEWNSLQVEKTNFGKKRTIYEGKSIAFENTSATALTLSKGKSAPSVKVPIGNEELIIIKEGNLELASKDRNETLSTGSIVLVFEGNEYEIRNTGDDEVTYYVLRWTGNRKNNSAYKGSSLTVVKNWEDIKFEETKKGGIRNIIREPTPFLSEFEMHTTTLNEGMKSHDPHTHIEAEIILVRYGNVEEMIDGKPFEVEPGSLIFLDSMIPHGIRNIGKGACEYYAFKWQLPMTE
ncbi:MAG: cupin domain-containing protein [Cyclobacteriaceae bacterium]